MPIRRNGNQLVTRSLRGRRFSVVARAPLIFVKDLVMFSKSFLLITGLLALGNPADSHATSLDRRLFDFTPISNTNAVVARIGNTVEIPVTEYQAYIAAEKQIIIRTNSCFAERRTLLDDLVGEYLLVNDAYKDGIDQRPDFLRKMDYTRTILLSEFLTAQEVDAKAKTAEEYNHLLNDLQNRVFDAAEIIVSNEAFEKLRKVAKDINALDPASTGRKTSSAKIRAVMEKLDESVLARYNGEKVSVKEVFAIYANLHAPRPRLETNQDLIDILRPLVMPSLLAAEARKQGIENLADFKNKVDQNRNALLRIYEHGVLQQQASDGMKVPDLSERLQAWYKQNAERYAIEGPSGSKTTPPYSEVHERVEGDYSVDLWERLEADKIHSLRKSCRIQIDDAVLRRYQESQ
jgi:hypothetical protein